MSSVNARVPPLRLLAVDNPSDGEVAVYQASSGRFEWVPQSGGGGSGTVTSVALTETGTALTITGSPITSSGTINIAGAGTSSQVILGDLSLGTLTSGTVTSVGLTETGSALTITGSPVTSSGTINIAGAGTSSQVILGDLSLGTLPTGTIGGTIAVTQVAFGSATDEITGSANLTFDGTNLSVAGYVKSGTGVYDTNGATDLTLKTNGGSSSGQVDLKNGADGNLIFTPNGAGLLQIEGSTNPGSVKLMCEAGTHGVTIQSPAHSANATYTFKMPTSMGTDGQVLTTDGSSQTSWTTVSASATPAGSDREIQFNDNGSFGAVSAFKIGSSNTIGIGTSPSSAYSLKTLSNIQSLGTVDASSLKGTNGGSATQPTFKYSNNNTGLFFSATDQIDLTMGGSNKLSFGSAGEILIGGTDSGTSGQVLTSGGSGSAMSWATASGGGGINWPNSIDTYTGTFGYGDNLGIGFNGRLSTQSPTSAQWANSTIRYRPWICMKEGNLANWYIWCADLPTGGSNQTWTVGLWNVGTDNVPGTLKCTSTIIISSSTGILSGTWTASAGQDLGVKVGDTYWVGYYSTYGSSASSASLYWFTGAQVTAFPGRRPNSNTGNTSDPCRVYGSSGDISTIGDNPTITGADTQTTSGWPIMWYTVS